MTTIFKKLLIPVFIAVAGLSMAAAVDFYVSRQAEPLIFFEIGQVPAKKAVLVLGTIRSVQGRINLFYKYRLDAAAELFNSGKVDAVIVSGDNSRPDYDEPTNMKRDLVERGVPEEFVTIDYAGFRTLDSVVRAEKIFGLSDYIIVSQPFHLSRAIFLARANGQEVVGYAARDVGGRFGASVRTREVLARLKAFLDVYVLRVDPKFLGGKEEVVYRKRNK